jgi:hypothetical protein
LDYSHPFDNDEILCLASPWILDFRSLEDNNLLFWLPFYIFCNHGKSVWIIVCDSLTPLTMCYWMHSVWVDLSTF